MVATHNSNVYAHMYVHTIHIPSYIDTQVIRRRRTSIKWHLKKSSTELYKLQRKKNVNFQHKIIEKGILNVPSCHSLTATHTHASKCIQTNWFRMRASFFSAFCGVLRQVFLNSFWLLRSILWTFE